MDQQTHEAEPLNNADLESTMYGLRMALTPEESVLARAKFLEHLRSSVLAVPTAKAVATNPDGTVPQNTEISLLIATTAAGVSGVPAFTSLAGLRGALPQSANGMFLNGSDLARILGPSPHKLFVDGPDLHVEVEQAELQRMAFVAQQMDSLQEGSVRHNERLEAALQALAGSPEDTRIRQEVVGAFMSGFCLIPIAGTADADAECVVLMAEEVPGMPGQEVELLLDDGALLCFSSYQALRAWDTKNRIAIPMEGKMLVQLCTEAEGEAIRLNAGLPTETNFTVLDNQLSLP